MKKQITLLALLVAVITASIIMPAVTATAENRIITCANNDPADEVFQYNFWQWKGTTAILLVSSSTNRTPVINLKGKNTVTVTAVNAGGESPHSTNLVITAKPEKPTGLDTIP